MKQLPSKGNVKELIFKDLTSSDAKKNLQLENKCRKLLRSDEIRFVGVINSMGNLIFGEFNACVDLLENDEKRKQFYMQMALEISMRKDFDDILGKINHIITNRNNVLMIAMPINNHVLLISAKPNSNAKQIIEKTHVLGFFKSEA